MRMLFVMVKGRLASFPWAQEEERPSVRAGRPPTLEEFHGLVQGLATYASSSLGLSSCAFLVFT